MYIYYFWISCLYTRCTYSQCMPRTRISTTFEPTCVDLVSRCGTCFWDCPSCICNEVWEVWWGQSVRTMLKEFRGYERGFEPHRKQGYGCFSRRPCAIFASLVLSLVLIILDVDFTALRLHSLSLSPFSCQAPSSSSLPSQFLSFCHRNNEIASATTALRTINLPKYTQLFVNKVF